MLCCLCLPCLELAYRTLCNAVAHHSSGVVSSTAALCLTDPSLPPPPHPTLNTTAESPAGRALQQERYPAPGKGAPPVANVTRESVAAAAAAAKDAVPAKKSSAGAAGASALLTGATAAVLALVL